MEIKQYQHYLKELLKYALDSDWLTIQEINKDGIHIGLDISDLTVKDKVKVKVKVEILLELRLIPRHGTIHVLPLLKKPYIMHPNISCDNLSICIHPPVGDEDSDWTASLVLLVHGVAQILMDPNFDDMILNSTACPAGHAIVKNIKEYMEQFQP